MDEHQIKQVRSFSRVVTQHVGTRPADAWLDRLKDGGKLILPLTTDKGFTASDWSNMHLRGAVFLITRDVHGFQAQWISPVALSRLPFHPKDRIRRPS